MRTRSWSRIIWRPQRRSVHRSSPCSRRTCRRITSPVCRRSSSVPARPPTYLPAQASSSSTSLAEGDTVELGNTVVTAIATPGHAPAHHAYAVADRRRGTEDPWLIFSGDSLLIGDVGRPDLHLAGDARGQARLLHGSLRRLLELPDHVVLYPSHYGGSVCGRGLSGNPISSIGFERAHNQLITLADADAFAGALLTDMPPARADQAAIVAANRSGRTPARA
jgi:glyoxylase-like metal-dependent hydrolase (beta-lactamase superfamily II)